MQEKAVAPWGSLQPVGAKFFFKRHTRICTSFLLLVSSAFPLKELGAFIPQFFFWSVFHKCIKGLSFTTLLHSIASHFSFCILNLLYISFLSPLKNPELHLIIKFSKAFAYHFTCTFVSFVLDNDFFLTSDKNRIQTSTLW